MTLLNTLAEDNQVFLLLDDGRILTRTFDDKPCAETAVEQMKRLQIPAERLLAWFGWVVHEERDL